MTIQNIRQVHQFLDSKPAFKSDGKKAADFSLHRFEKFCAAIGNPQQQFPAVHVAGSNGKGSTCSIIASVYRQAGYKVGVYISPHIISYAERFTINGEQLSDDELVLFFREHETLIKSFRLTYFEISTAIAFWWFAKQQVDLGIIEVGLGGRLDATNIITPLVSVITNITLDHTDILGDTIPEIAREKAGIIKQGIPVVIGNVPEEAQEVIKRAASERKSRVYNIKQLKPIWKDGNYALTKAGRQIWMESKLQTPVQAYNIAAAYGVMEILQKHFNVTEKQFKEGIKQVRKLYPNKGRFEKLHPEFDWYFDGGHNLDAVRAMKQMVETIRPVNEAVLVLSIMKDKINEKMMIEFSEFKKIVYHTLPLGRAATLKDIRAWLPKATSFPATQKAQDHLLKEFSSELVIFAGSFYFYETVRDWLSTYMEPR